jgi:hypothetical protein
MRYLELKIDNKSIKSTTQINEILRKNNFYWLIDAEIEEAVIEIKKNTIIWHSGNFYSGNWQYGIFKGGNFWGNFINGIFESGNFKGNWHSGINLQSEKI